MKNLEELQNAFTNEAEQFDLAIDVLGEGPINAEVAIIGEGPGETEASTGIPFSGGSGRLLFDGLRKYGLHRANVYVTNVVKRQISLSRKGDERHIVHRDELQKWIGLAKWELSHLPNLKYILVLGNYALEAIVGEDKITNWRGSVIPVTMCDSHNEERSLKAVLTINPAYAMREPKLEP